MLLELRILKIRLSWQTNDTLYRKFETILFFFVETNILRCICSLSSRSTVKSENGKFMVQTYMEYVYSCEQHFRLSLIQMEYYNEFADI